MFRRPRWLLHTASLALIGGCALGSVAAQPATLPAPTSNVGDIAFDPARDRVDFTRCGTYDAAQYYNTGTTYQGGLWAIRQQLVPATLPRSAACQRGYVTIRFLVNCRGETDRFRATQLDSAYHPTQFSAPLVAELLRRTQALRAWQPGTYAGPGPLHGQVLDTYYYLLFKIAHGRVVDILP